ncbi:hypothetical protein VQ7734_03709 [Vibrio quintilis]|uniref:Uncharacterized protein n=1 Tax=Vibrio quintilis TaxID=1117707 RepID=A0A1M7YZ23_9VIBR|nr:hypothetical protein VQ7734_03709 [Vibrio quintilis]
MALFCVVPQAFVIPNAHTPRNFGERQKDAKTFLLWKHWIIDVLDFFGVSE